MKGYSRTHQPSPAMEIKYTNEKPCSQHTHFKCPRAQQQTILWRGSVAVGLLHAVVNHWQIYQAHFSSAPQTLAAFKAKTTTSLSHFQLANDIAYASGKNILICRYAPWAELLIGINGEMRRLRFIRLMFLRLLRHSPNARVYASATCYAYACFV